MKKKYFYSHIVEMSEISIEIADMDMPNEDRVKLIELAHENLHHKILDHVLSQLSEQDKKIFLSRVGVDDHENTWKFLNEKISNIHTQILDLASEMKKELRKDISDAKKTKK